MNNDGITHPVFLCNLTAGIATIAARIAGRRTVEQSRGHSTWLCSGDVATEMTRILAYAKSTPQLGHLDFAPVTSLFSDMRPGRQQSLHGDLESLAALTLDPGHVVIPKTEEDDVAIVQLIAAIHLACFGSLPFTIPKRGIFGCEDCKTGHGDSRGHTYFSVEIALANSQGVLAPGYRVPSKIEKLARFASADDCVWMPREESLTRLVHEATKKLAAIRAAKALAATPIATMYDRPRAERAVDASA